MGSCLSYAANRLLSPYFDDLIELEKDNTHNLYMVHDKNQLIKPEGRTKDYVSAKNMNMPERLDADVHSGCDTIWKQFKRAVWCYPNNPFLGKRRLIHKASKNGGTTEPA